jgi:hypothetical protein
MTKEETEQLVKKPYEETSSKSADIVATMVSELQSKGLVITEEMVRDTIAPKMSEVFKLAYTFGVDMGSQFTIKRINEDIEQRLSNCEKNIVDPFKQLVNTATNEKHS